MENSPKINENIYSLLDAVVVGCMLINPAEACRPRKNGLHGPACYTIAPYMTVTGGGSWRNTIFYPYLHASTYGRGCVLDFCREIPYRI